MLRESGEKSTEKLAVVPQTGSSLTQHHVSVFKGLCGGRSGSKEKGGRWEPSKWNSEYMQDGVLCMDQHKSEAHSHKTFFCLQRFLSLGLGALSSLFRWKLLPSSLRSQLLALAIHPSQAHELSHTSTAFLTGPSCIFPHSSVSGA